MSLITVSGTVDDKTATIDVNGVAVVVTGEFFTATNVPLMEGANTITATATDSAGNSGWASIQVTLDTVPPVVAITTPADGTVVSSGSVTVTGTVDDAEATVEVNGVAVVVSSETFTVNGVPLALGVNTLTATARDPVGNQGAATIQVTLK